MTKQKILKEISKKDLLDYKVLADKNNFAFYPEILDQLLQKAESEFEQILKLAGDQINFKNVVEKNFHYDRNLNVLYGFLDSYDGTNNSDLTRKIIQKYEPKMVDYYHKTGLNKKYYELLKKVLKQKLTADQKKSVELALRDMEIAGIGLPDAKRTELKKIKKELSNLAQKFRNNVTDSKKQFYYEFKNRDSLAEMPQSDLDLAAAEAKKRNSKAAYVFTLSPPSLRAILKYCTDRSVRELFYKKANGVAREGKYNNRSVILKTLKLRLAEAELLGFKNYADFVLQKRMAKDTKQITALLNKIYGKAKIKAKSEIKELAKFSGLKKFEEWDLSFYGEKFKHEKFKIEERELKKYFPLNQVVTGLFEIMSQLFGLEFKLLNVKSYHPDLQIFEVRRKQELLAYYIADFTARDTKKNGAWCNHLRAGYFSEAEYEVPIIINVMNFPAANGQEPALLSHRDVETLFHEFGHAIHLMLSSKNYGNLNGFHTEWDFVEFPSQLLENYCWETEALELFARHYQTGKVLPGAMIKTLRNTKTFMSGYSTLRQLEFAFLDLKLHTNKLLKSVTELDRFCKKITDQYGAIEKFKGYSMHTSFDHVFAGGYAAGYYSYIWAEILEADVFLKMKSRGALKPKTGLEYAEKVLMPGAKKSGMEIFKDFMGRNPDVGAFIKKHNLD